MEKFIHNLDSIPKNAKISIYGTSQSALEFFDYLKVFRKDIDITYFIDSYTSGRTKDVPVVNILDINEVQKEFKYIIIASHCWLEISKMLDNLGIHNYSIVRTCVFDFFNIAFKPLRLLNFSQEKINEYTPYFEKVKKILKYKEDRDLYDILTKAHVASRNVRFVFEYQMEHFYRQELQYFEYINKEEINTVIEAGVFDGRTTAQMLNILPNLKMSYSFEPFYELYESAPYYKEIENSKKVKVYPKVLLDKKEKIEFIESGPRSNITGLDYNGKNLRYVDSVTIDEFAQENNIKLDFIRLDVESAEYKVLKGAEKTIKRDRPQLAISIYHGIDQFAKLPLYMDSILDNYTFRLAHYSIRLAETVLYAIPNEKLKVSNT